MGQPLAAGGLQSELWTFTYRVGFSDLIGELDLDEAGLPSELALVPGLARLVGLGGIETESSPFGVRLNGPATLELEGAYAGQVRVRLQDLEVEVVGGQLQVRRSEEHTSELQSRGHLVCRLLLEKKNNIAL